jgi:hypothetical protein
VCRCQCQCRCRCVSTAIPNRQAAYHRLPAADPNAVLVDFCRISERVESWQWDEANEYNSVPQEDDDSDEEPP